MKNGDKNKSVASIILFSVYIYIYIYIYVCMYYVQMYYDWSRFIFMVQFSPLTNQ